VTQNAHLPKTQVEAVAGIESPMLLKTIGLVLQRHFVTARRVTVDVMRPPSDDLKVCGQQKIVRWPLASA
jgi:hypothetical protein